jgi:hypothetical protein
VDWVCVGSVYTESPELRSINEKILNIRKAESQNDGFLQSRIPEAFPELDSERRVLAKHTQ